MEEDTLENELETTENIEETNERKKKNFSVVNSVLFIYSIAMLISFFVGEFMKKILKDNFPEYSEEYKKNFILINIIFVFFDVCLVFLMIKPIKIKKSERQPYGFGKYFANLFINSALVAIGNTISILVNFLIMYLFSFIKRKETPSTSKSEFSSSKELILYLKLLNTCIFAPIGEELVWRKILIDRLALYSKRLAIFASGILFGIFHLNIRKLFPAMFTGWSYAYSYAETNNIFIPISFHMLQNSYSNLLFFIFFKKNLVILGMLLSLNLIIIFIGIFLLVVNKNAITVRGEESNFEDKWVLFKSYGMKCFIIEGIIIIIYKTIIR